MIITGGRVVDPAQGIDGIRDVAVSNGCIEKIGKQLPADTGEIIDAKGMLVTPGLIDLHAHVAPDVIPLSVDPDEAGITTGVTTVNDAGSCGWLNFHMFRKYIWPRAKTRVYSFVHMAPFGEAILPEIGYEVLQEDKIIDIIESNRDVIRGIKIRAVGELIHANQASVPEKAKKIADRAGVPLMVHLGMDRNETLSKRTIDDFIASLLGLLEKGDILTHAFTDNPGGVFLPGGIPVPGLEDALSRGVLLDAAPGKGHFSFKVAGKAIQGGILPHALGTDVVKLDTAQPHFYNVAAIMSKFVALGVSLESTIAMATSNSAKMLSAESECGNLKVGSPADITIIEMKKGDFLFQDGRAGNQVPGELFLIPRLVIKDGEKSEISNHIVGHLPGPSPQNHEIVYFEK